MNCGCNSAFRKEKKEAGEEVSNLRGSKRTMSCRNDRHLKFTPNFKPLTVFLWIYLVHPILEGSTIQAELRIQKI